MIYKDKTGEGDRECFVCLGRIRRSRGWWTCDSCHKGCCVQCARLRNMCACGSMFPDYEPGKEKN